MARLLGFKVKTWISHCENGDTLPNLVSAVWLSILYEVSVDELFVDLVEVIREEVTRENL